MTDTQPKRRRGPGEALAEYVGYIKAAGAAGISAKEIATKAGSHCPDSIIQTITPARKAGDVVMVGPGGRSPGRWYAREFAPPKRPPNPAPLRPLRQTLARGGEAVITAKTRRIYGPNNHDMRHTVRRLPDGYVSQLDAQDARPWAQAVAK